MAGFNLMGLMNEASKTAAGAARQEFKTIPLEKLVPNPTNEQIYEVGGVEELAQSIFLTGKVLQNILVAPADENGNYTIIAGHRRRLACQTLVEDGHTEFSEVPCTVIKEQDGLMQELILIQTNSTARIMSDMEKMRQAERATSILSELKNRKQISGRVRDIVAKMLNTTTGQLGRYNVISKGLKNETLWKAFERGKMGISAAYEAARLDEAGQNELAKKMEAEGSVKARDAVEQQKKSEVEKAAEEANEGLPMEKIYKVSLKPKYKASLTINYEEKNGKFYAGYLYQSGKGGTGTPINREEPYDTSQEAIEGIMIKVAEQSPTMHRALWGSGYAIVGNPDEEQEAAEETAGGWQLIKKEPNGDETYQTELLKGGKRSSICFRIKAVISYEKNSGAYTAMYTVVNPGGEEERWQYIQNRHFDIAMAAGEVALEVAKRGMDYAQPLYDNSYIDHIPPKAAGTDATPRATVPASQPKQLDDDKPEDMTDPIVLLEKKAKKVGYANLSACERCHLSTRCTMCCKACQEHKWTKGKNCNAVQICGNEEENKKEKDEIAAEIERDMADRAKDGVDYGAPYRIAAEVLQEAIDRLKTMRKDESISAGTYVNLGVAIGYVGNFLTQTKKLAESGGLYD